MEVKYYRSFCFGMVFCGFCMGFSASEFHEAMQPKAEISINADNHTPLNHGQKSIWITLPEGTEFSSFGGCSAIWESNEKDFSHQKWHEIVCNIEKFDDKIGGFRPSDEIEK